MGEYRYLELTIQYVFRGNFNDSYYLETVYLDLGDVVKEGLVWIDPYQGRSKKGDTKIAIQSCSDKAFVLLRKQGDKTEAFTYPIDYLHICCEDFDDSKMLVSHIHVRKEKQ